MIKESKKYLACYESEQSILGYAITVFLCTPALALCIGLLIKNGNLSSALKFCGKWSAIILSLFSIIFILCAYHFSGTLVFTEDSIVYKKRLFSKKGKEIPYYIITECIISHGLWKQGGGYVRGRKILLFNKAELVASYESNYKIALKLLNLLDETKVRIIDDNGHKKSIGRYYNIDFADLSFEQQSILVKHYCKLMKSNERSGEKILNKKLRK